MLKDYTGSVRMRWHTFTEGSTFLNLYDTDGKSRWAWSALSDGSARLALLDRDGNTRAVLGNTDLIATATGEKVSIAESSLVLYDNVGSVTFRAP